MMESSIGRIDEVYFDSKNDRTKAFFTAILRTEKEVDINLNRFLHQARGTRLSLRLVVEGIPDNRLRTIFRPHLGQMMVCEAIIPITREGVKIVYYGWNDRERMTNPNLRAAERQLLDQVLKRRGAREHCYDDYEIEFSVQKKNWTRDDVQKLLEIYGRTFSGYLLEFTQASVTNMLENNLVSLVRRRQTGEIVAVAMGEMVEVEIGTRVLRLCELSEVATHPEFQRRGLSHLAFGKLRDELIQSHVEVIFSETRAASYGMMAVAHDAGFVVSGRLEEHCVISSPFSEIVQEGVYGDLIMFSLPTRSE